MRNVVVLLTLFALATTTLAADYPQTPGRWRVTITTVMPSLDTDIPPMTWEHCVTEEDLKDSKRAVPNDPKSPCKVTQTKIEGNEVWWSIDCPTTGMSGKGHLVFTDKSYQGDLTMKVRDEEMMKQTHTGKWLGTCTK